MAVTTISGAFGAVTNSLLGYYRLGYWDSAAANSGVLSGLVGITAGCAVVEPEAAMVIGIVAAFVYTYSSEWMLKLKVLVRITRIFKCRKDWFVGKFLFFTYESGAPKSSMHKEQHPILPLKTTNCTLKTIPTVCLLEPRPWACANAESAVDGVT